MALKPVSVSQLNGYVKRILQSDPILGNVSVVGEISNLKFHGSGHVYFTLKDADSKVNCFLGADNKKNIRFELSEGMEITIHGYIYVYERGGSYSINVRDIDVCGLGNLSVAFEKLKEKLEKEGLFDSKYKMPLPTFPHRVAIVTSETGAAVQDILKIIKKRNNIVDILIYPVLVQGPAAAGEIAAAIDRINHEFTDMDTIITGRGGGSMEELWAFNEEIVARSIFNSRIPVISAVGHETDFTIADFVADKRAETPTAAAVMAVPDIAELKRYCEDTRFKLSEGLAGLLQRKELMLKAMNPDSLYMLLEGRVTKRSMQLENLKRENISNINRILKENETKINNIKSNLEALNPMAVLERGYAAITDGAGNIRCSADGFTAGDNLTVLFADGDVLCDVADVRRKNNVNSGKA